MPPQTRARLGTPPQSAIDTHFAFARFPGAWEQVYDRVAERAFLIDFDCAEEAGHNGRLREKVKEPQRRWGGGGGEGRGNWGGETRVLFVGYVGWEGQNMRLQMPVCK